MIFRVIIKILYSILLFIETVIAIKFVLVFINGRPESSFYKLIDNLSNNFISPFQGILGTNSVKLYIFTIDLNCVAALLIYMVVAFFLIELLKGFSDEHERK